LSFLNPVNQFLDIIGKAADVSKKIFSQSTNTKLVEKITQLTFNSVSAATNIRMYKGVPLYLMPTLKNQIISTVGVSSKWAADVKEVLAFEQDLGG
jgi:hypothetical protein